MKLKPNTKRKKAAPSWISQRKSIYAPRKTTNPIERNERAAFRIKINTNMYNQTTRE
jgi:hypothetical protein